MPIYNVSSSDKRRDVAIEYYGKPHCEGDI